MKKNENDKQLDTRPTRWLRCGEKRCHVPTMAMVSSLQLPPLWPFIMAGVKGIRFNGTCPIAVTLQREGKRTIAFYRLWKSVP